MPPPAEGASSNSEDRDWTIERAETLLNSLTGVLSARMVARPGGEIDEIHILTTQEVTPKQTVRNVESALLAHLGLSVDHRKISVARTSVTELDAEEIELGPPRDPTTYRPPAQRLLFVGHELESERPHRVRARVSIEWEGERFVGEASGTDLPRARLELLASALLHGIERVLDLPAGEDEPQQRGVALALDGVKLIEAFDRRYALVGVNAVDGRNISALSGSAVVQDAVERAVVMATLQATDRWVRGRL